MTTILTDHVFNAGRMWKDGGVGRQKSSPAVMRQTASYERISAHSGITAMLMLHEIVFANAWKETIGLDDLL